MNCTPTTIDCSFTENTTWTGWPHGNTLGGGIYLRDSNAVVSGCAFSGNQAAYGGAVHTYGESLVIADCVFSENEGYYGGGLNVDGQNTRVVLTDCLFARNGYAWTHGGGASVGAEAVVTGCTFEENVAEFGGALWCGAGSVVTDCVFSRNSADYTGGVDCIGSSTFERCTFSENSSGWNAGAIYIHDGGTFRECVISGNVAERSGGGIHCGSSHSGPTEIIDCVIVDNYTYETGGGVACAGTLGIFIRGCTISGNRADEGGGAIAAAGSARPVVENSILSFSHAGGSVFCDSTSSALLACTDVFGNEEGDWTGCIADQESASGNSSLDPLFCDMYSGDFTLCANSPCLPVTRDCEELIGALAQGCDNCDSPVEGALLVASCDEEIVTLRWTLDGLDGYAGLNIYRVTEGDGDFVKLNRELLPTSLPGTYIDATVWPATTFRYQLKAVHENGTEECAGESVSVTTPGRLTAVLRAPSPNPFSDRSVFELDLPSSSGHAAIGVFDVAGRCVRRLHHAPLSRGRHEFAWDGLDSDGSPCAAGVYFVRCESGDLVLRQSAVLLR